MISPVFGWRDEALSWEPSFLPFLLGRMNRYREGPDVLLELAKELRGQPAIAPYRKLQGDLASEDAERSDEACRTLSAAADEVATSLDAPRQELGVLRRVLVEVFPDAVGAVSGAVLGAALAGTEGAAAGGLAGVVGNEALTVAHGKLWGWFLDELPVRSARKLLSRPRWTAPRTGVTAPRPIRSCRICRGA